ncbi:TVP38/TMEM64 family protein [Elusimicrobiota bacterium]
MTDEKNKKNFIKPIVFLVIVILLVILSGKLGLGSRLGDLKDWINTLGIWGPVVFILIYAVATVAAVPGSAMTIFAGSVFGSLFGVVIVSIASTLGAGLAFLVSRYFARASIVKWLENNEKFKKLDELTEKHGGIIVAITRLVPLFPFTLLNYGFGLTKVKFKIYFFGSWLCMLPGTILYVVGADAITTAMSEGKVPWTLIAVFVIAVIMVSILVKFAGNKLKKKEAGQSGGSDEI